jgi:hypothetical protein
MSAAITGLFVGKNSLATPYGWKIMPKSSSITQLYVLEKK